MKASINSIVLEYRFDPSLTLRVYVECSLAKHEENPITGHVIDKDGVIIETVTPKEWDAPMTMIGSVHRGDFAAIEAWAEKIMHAMQCKVGWRDAA